MLTVAGGLDGLGLAAAGRRFLSNPATAFLGICVVGLVLCAIVRFTAAEEVSTGIWLNAMHIAAAVPIFGGLIRELQASSG